MTAYSRDDAILFLVVPAILMLSRGNLFLNYQAVYTYFIDAYYMNAEGLRRFRAFCSYKAHQRFGRIFLNHGIMIPRSYDNRYWIRFSKLYIPHLSRCVSVYFFD